MRHLLACFALIAASGCATDATRHCGSVTGGSWTRLSVPPDNAEALLAMQGLPNDRDAIWYGKGEDRRTACIYAGSLTNPGCGAATVYEFAKVEDRWTFRGMAMQSCDPNRP